MAARVKITVHEVQCFERDVTLRMPFRFGVATLTEAPQAFVRVRVGLASGAEAWGKAAEILAPKWFDKNPELSNQDNFRQLQTSLRLAADSYLADHHFRTAFGLFAEHYEEQLDSTARRGLEPLIGGFGPALLDRAVLDALCLLCDVNFFDALRGNLPGLEASSLLPQFSDFDFDGFLSSLEPGDSLQARHTVGLVDPITAADQTEAERVDDGFPETLEEVIETYGNNYFKIKVSGSIENDVKRLRSVASVLGVSDQPYFATLDGNEQYRDLGGVAELWRALRGEPQLRRFLDSIVFIEQPVERKTTFQQPLVNLEIERPLVIDEADWDLEAFPRARRLGYRGVSSKVCKGMYKSFINAARCACWNDQEGKDIYFMTGEDLMTQAGVAVQQDLALVSLLGLNHLERNGHHYVKGMSGLSDGEQEGFLAAHPDLYERTGEVVRLRIREGKLRIASLACPGFAVGAEPEWASMREVEL